MDDSFSCPNPNCGAKFTIASFPFEYEYHTGGMGVGSEWVKVLDSPCPNCKAIIPQTFFATCRTCKKGAAKTSCAEIKTENSSYLYHFGCLNKLGSYDKSKARPYGQSDSPRPSGVAAEIPNWLWVVAGAILLIWFFNSRH